MAPPPKILAAVVTHNRLGLLQRCVESLRGQTRRPDAILIVDNSSTDGTSEWLGAQGDLKVERRPNLGSAGGFNFAAKTGYGGGYDWVWMMDDDTIPRADALERLVASPAFGRADTGFVYSLQVYPDGTVPRNDPGPTSPDEWALTVLSERCLPVLRCSFVAVMFSRKAIEKAGYPLTEMFFMSDDYEYTRRVVESGFRGYCVLDSIVLHDTKIPTSFDIRSWSPMKKRHSVRNQVYYIRTSSDPVSRKARLLAHVFAKETVDLLRGASSLTIVAWAVRGLFFNPPVERPEPAPKGGA
jgi:GT2 family glycosyltransferase